MVNYKNFFTKKKEFITIEELNKMIKIENIDQLNGKDKISNIATLDSAKNDEISFLSNVKYVPKLQDTNAGFCFLQEKFVAKLGSKTKAVVVKNPHYAYCVVLNYFFSVPIFENNGTISPKATISEKAKIGKNVEIQAGVFIDDDVVVGDNCKICANAVINHNVILGEGVFVGSNSTLSYCEIGDKTIIQNNVAIGHCGFGFAHDSGFNHKIPQLGIVKIGKYVEIYAGTTIARGAFDDTVIGDNTKIDSLCQIAHGVKIGQGCFFAGQCGVAGSSQIGMFCQFGGQTGVAGHLNIGNFITVAGKSGIAKNVKDKEMLGGFPAKNIKDWHRETVALQNLVKKHIKK